MRKDIYLNDTGQVIPLFYHMPCRAERTLIIADLAITEKLHSRTAGSVRRIVPQATGAISDAATFTAVITLESTELDLLPGLTGRAEIQRDANGS